MLQRFSSLRPQSKREALACLSDLEDPVVIAGGTDLLVRMKKGESHRNLVDITSINELSGAAEHNKHITIGCASTFHMVSNDTRIRACAPSLAEAASWIGSPQIRSMATIGGNLVNASPAADSIAPLLVHDAELTLESKDQVRTESLEAFIRGPYKTSISAAELLSSINIKPLDGYVEGYRRVAKRAAWAISRLSVAWAMALERGTFADVRLAIGSCTPTPFRARNVERFLAGKERKPGVAAEAVELCLAEIRSITGERPTFVYKLPVLRDLLHAILGGG